MIDYGVLKTELQTDPTALGYASALSDAHKAVLLNTVNTGITIDRGVIPSYEIVNATVPAEWAALTAAEKQRYQTIVGAGLVDSQHANARAAFQAMFGAGTTTRANLTALLTRQGTRAEQLFGSGTVLSHQDIAQAMRS